MRPQGLRELGALFAACLLTALPGRALSQQAPMPVPPPPPADGTFQIIRPHSPRIIVDNAANRTQPQRRSSFALMATNILAFNAETLSETLEFGKPGTTFTFGVTNVSPEAVTIQAVRTSCGCTIPQLPSMPWTLTPGANGTFKVQMNVAGKTGVVVKSVTLTTDHGIKTLYVRTTIDAPPSGQMGAADRMRNLQIAMANRQMVFKGDCARCHATPAEGKMGQELFTAACGICHEAEHRASMVPDLHALQTETNADYWRTWITSGKQGTLMPAFSKEHQGILTKEQIDSLVEYLVEAIPPLSGNTKPASETHPQPH